MLQEKFVNRIFGGVGGKPQQALILMRCFWEYVGADGCLRLQGGRNPDLMLIRWLCPSPSPLMFMSYKWFFIQKFIQSSAASTSKI